MLVGITASQPITEPVELFVAKEWLVVEHDEHDGLISELITSVRRMLESRTKKVFVPSTVIIELITPGSFTLPRMPVNTFTKLEVWSCSDRAYQEITDSNEYRIVGETFYTDLPGQKRITYEAGYTDFPEDLKLAMKSEICYRYENRGDKTLNADLSSTTESYISNYISYAWQ